MGKIEILSTRNLWRLRVLRNMSEICSCLYEKLENHVGLVPAYCAAVRLTSDLWS